MTAISIYLYNFNTLYTNLPQETIFDTLTQLYSKIFEHSHHLYIAINTSKQMAFFTSSTHLTNYKYYLQNWLIILNFLTNTLVK